MGGEADGMCSHLRIVRALESAAEAEQSESQQPRHHLRGSRVLRLLSTPGRMLTGPIFDGPKCRGPVFVVEDEVKTLWKEDLRLIPGGEGAEEGFDAFAGGEHVVGRV